MIGSFYRGCFVMRKIGCLFLVPVAMFALIIAPSDHLDVALRSLGLVMGPTGVSTPSETYLDAAQNYLANDGFAGTLLALTTPEENNDASYSVGLADLIEAVESQYDAGAMSPDDPLYVFGYSQSATIASMAEEYLYAYGIPTDDLHFTLIGDAASAHGGFMSTWDWLVNLFGFHTPAGAITPGEFYPTDVYTIPGDNWADTSWLPSTFSFAHLEYLGLTAQQIADATLSHVDGLTQYWTIPHDSFDWLAALWDAWQAVW